MSRSPHPTTTPESPATPEGRARRVLPLTPLRPTGARAAMTCRYRCADQCSHPAPNPTDHPTFRDVVESLASRRAVVRGGSLTAAVVGLGALAGGTPAAASPATAPTGAAGLAAATPRPCSPFGFTAIPAQPADLDAVVVPEGFTWDCLIAWGDPVVPGAPRFDMAHQTAAAQAMQFGYNNDYVTVIRGRDQLSAQLVCNHEYVNPELMFPGFTGTATMTREQAEIGMAAHGMTVIGLTRRDATSRWVTDRRDRRNRRITATTPFQIVGPARGSSLLRTSADPRGRTVLGTINNCAGGTTPWGTVLSGEENFHGFFKPRATPTPEEARYGITGTPVNNWHLYDSRWDLTVEPNEANRFGWVVEVDPSDPTSTPKKLTALGRFKHEGAESVVGEDGRVVVYMGDDERFEYIYRFISRKKLLPGHSRAAREHNATLLHEGDLSVGVFTGDGLEDGEHDGTGRWIPLTRGGRSMVPGFTLEQVLVYTRLAADAVGPTKMDRPEDIQPRPGTDEVYAALTNNSKRTPSQVDEANPRAANKHGQVLRLSRTGGHVGDTFAWKLVLIAGDPADPETYFNGYAKSEVSSISCPDNVAFDSRGNLWIATDGNQLGHCDGLYLMPEDGHLQQFLSVPVGAENCGPFITWDDRTVLTAVQHPGEVDGASYERPASRFPYRGDPGPRPGIIQVRPRRGSHPA